MQSPRSAGEMQTLPARPVVKNTYGKPKTVVAPIMQADESFTSDLTSLSQLSALPSSSAVCKAQNDAMLPEAGIESDQDEDEAKDIADSGYYPARKSVKEALEDIDAASDAAGEDGDRQFSTLFAQTDVRLVQTTEQPAEQSLDHKRERVVSGASSSSTNDFHRVHNQNLASTSSPQRTDARHSSPPTSPRLHAAEAQHDTDDEEENILVKHSRTALRPARKILDSEDDESDEPSKSNRVSVSARKHSQFKARSRQVIEDEEEEQGQSSESETEDLPSLQHAGKSRKVHVGSQAEDEGDIETQKTEAIEQYEDSQIYQSNRLSESPDVKKKSRKPRPPSKKDEEEAHRIAEKARRSRHASIMPRSKPARPLSEISQRLQGAEHSNRPLSSMRPSMTHRPRSGSAKPALSLRAASIPLASMQPSAKPLSKAIEIGSSSAIYDFNMEEDSYDPSYLKAETQSQSQDSLETRQESKPTISKKAGTSPICDAEEDSDEELPDAAKVLKERHEREKKAKALQAKKAALLARQQETTEKARLQADVKGKGREIVMDLDSDPEELEIEVVRAATPVIKADHRSPRSHKLMRRLTMKTVKKEHDDDMSESQFKRAGRTFHHGDENVVVNPHVTTKASKSKPTRKHEHAVTSHGVNNLLMEKAKQQALSDKIKRMEDWKRRGGTLRHDHGNEELPQADDDEEISEDRAKELMNAIQARAIDADEEDEDEEGDEDYIGSDEEAILSGEEVGSADEAESVGNDDDGESAIGSDSGKNYDKVAHGESGEPTSSGDISSVATTQVIASDKSDVSDAESEDAIVVSTRIKPTMRMAVEDENSQETSSAQPQMTRNLSEESQAAQATQYHDFVVKAAAPAFPEFDKINDISLTQVFGKVGATQAPPQASRAPLDEADGFSQLFEEDDGGGFSQSTIATQTGTVANAAGPIPSMFRRGSDSSPEVQRHAFGEAPMLLDAALRDAQIREEAERAYEQVQFDRTRPMDERQENYLTRTPGSTISDEMPPLPPVTMDADRYSDRGMSIDDVPSEEGSDEVTRMEDINSPSIPRKLRRAGDEEKESPKRPLNAFDILQMGQQKHMYGKDASKKQKKKKSDFIAEEVEESEDEGEYSMLRKIHEEGDEEDGSDLDGEVEELVDDEKGDPDEEEAQDEMVDEHHRDWIQKDEAKTHKVVEKVIAGKLKKRRRGDDGGLSDSDYDDDIMHREAKARKPKKFSSKMEALTANPETQSFAQAGMDDGTADINGDFLEAQNPTSEAASEEDEYGSEFENLPVHRPSRRYQDERHAYSRDYEKSIIDKAIYGVPSSPQQEVVIEDSLTVITSRTMMHKKSGMDCFDDIELTYAETQTLNRRVVQLEREESQNENGRGPGRTSAVTNFVRRQGQNPNVAGATGAGRAVKASVQSNTVLKRKEKQGKQPALEVGNRGRLAAARHSKR